MHQVTGMKTDNIWNAAVSGALHNDKDTAKRFTGTEEGTAIELSERDSYICKKYSRAKETDNYI